MPPRESTSNIGITYWKAFITSSAISLFKSLYRQRYKHSLQQKLQIVNSNYISSDHSETEVEDDLLEPEFTLDHVSEIDNADLSHLKDASDGVSDTCSFVSIHTFCTQAVQKATKLCGKINEVAASALNSSSLLSSPPPFRP